MLVRCVGIMNFPMLAPSDAHQIVRIIIKLIKILMMPDPTGALFVSSKRKIVIVR